MLQLPLYSEPLPRCEGPKLQCFHDRTATVNFIRLISANSPQESGQSHVFEVSIQSKTYALKVFKFYDDEEDRAALQGAEHDLVSLDILHAHADPFYSECRAYGRLIENDLNGKVAVRCHGYLAVSAEREEELRGRFDVYDWDRLDAEYAKPAHRRQPFRAILKDIVTTDTPFIEKVVKRMLRDLKRMQRVGVYPMDVKARNYKGGQLLDFSVAITEPHYLFIIKPGFQVKRYKRADLVSWQELVSDEKIVTWERATRNKEYCKKLRSFDT